MLSSSDKIMIGGIASIATSVILTSCAHGISLQRYFALSLLPLGYAFVSIGLDELEYRSMQKKWKEGIKNG